MTDLHDKARALLEWHKRAANNGVSTEPEDNLADTIAELLAENERLTAERQHVYASGVSDGRNGTPCEAIRMQQEIDELRARAEAAESRLRELASAEPVAWMDPNMPITMHHRNKALGVGPSCTIPLIRRPSMEGKP